MGVPAAEPIVATTVVVKVAAGPHRCEFLYPSRDVRPLPAASRGWGKRWCMGWWVRRCASSGVSEGVFETAAYFLAGGVTVAEG